MFELYLKKTKDGGVLAYKFTLGLTAGDPRRSYVGVVLRVPRSPLVYPTFTLVAERCRAVFGL